MASTAVKRILTIPNGQSASNVISGKLVGLAKSGTIQAPGALTGVVSVQVAADEVSPSFDDLYNLATAVTAPINRATRFDLSGSRSIRVNSASAEAAQRDFELTLHFEI